MEAFTVERISNRLRGLSVRGAIDRGPLMESAEARDRTNTCIIQVYIQEEASYGKAYNNKHPGVAVMFLRPHAIPTQFRGFSIPSWDIGFVPQQSCASSACMRHEMPLSCGIDVRAAKQRRLEESRRRARAQRQVPFKSHVIKNENGIRLDITLDSDTKKDDILVEVRQDVLYIGVLGTTSVYRVVRDPYGRKIGHSKCGSQRQVIWNETFKLNEFIDTESIVAHVEEHVLHVDLAFKQRKTGPRRVYIQGDNDEKDVEEENDTNKLCIETTGEDDIAQKQDADKAEHGQDSPMVDCLRANDDPVVDMVDHPMDDEFPEKKNDTHGEKDDERSAGHLSDEEIDGSIEDCEYEEE